VNRGAGTGAAAAASGDARAAATAAAASDIVLLSNCMSCSSGRIACFETQVGD
jgi:hypothetical protein